jgi:alpha-glucosidase
MTESTTTIDPAAAPRTAPATDAPLWWRDGVIYQIYPRSFQDSNGDGIGDLRGIITRLDYLHDVLDVDAVWLSPFFPSPMADFGYDVSDYTGVDPMFGTLADFDELVRQMHERDMKLIIDYVPNHSSDQHPWFVESRSSRTNPKRDWYVWADAKPDGSLPNNWVSVFGGPAWEWDEATGQCYLHSFLKEQPDLNWRNPAVKQAMFDVLRFWMDRGVDGFRLDAVHFIMKDPDLRDNPPAPPAVVKYKPREEYDAQLHIHDKGHEEVHQVFREMRRLLEEYSAERPRMAVGEIHIPDWKEWATYYGEELDEIHLPFNFGLLWTDWNAADVREVVDAVETSVPAGGWPNYVLGNHDEHRIATRIGLLQARLAMMLLLTLRGTPTIYYGDELGMHDVDIPPERQQDPWGKTAGTLGRDPERTPMQWDDSPHAGFCSPAAEPWLPVAEDFRQMNVAAEQGDPHSMLTLTRQLIALRHGSPALTRGSYRLVNGAPDTCFVFYREDGRERRMIALNFGDADQTVSLPEDSGTVVISSYLDREADAGVRELRLRPHEGVIVAI